MIRQPPAGDFSLQPARAFGAIWEIDPVDLVEIGVKATAYNQLPGLLQPLLHVRTTLFSAVVISAPLRQAHRRAERQVNQ